MVEQPTKALILRRLRVKIDGRPGGSVRAVNPKGHKVFTSGRRGWVVEHALMWRALGYDGVEVSFTTPKNPRPDFRAFPATRDEAIECIRELAAGRLPGRWQLLLTRIKEQTDGID